jgi:hypothetical protein
MTHSRRLAVIASCVVVVVPATAAVAISGVVHFGSVAPSGAVQAGPPVSPPVAAGKAGVTAVPVGVATAFGVFRRPQTAQDTTVALSTAGLRALGPVQGQVGADPGLARTVLSNVRATISLVPANATHLCMVGSAGGATTAQCAVASEADTSGIVGLAGGAGGELLYGAMPDGTHNLVVTDTSGKTTPVDISAGGGFAVHLAAAGTTLTYKDGSGQTKSEPLFVPPPPPPPHAP